MIDLPELAGCIPPQRPLVVSREARTHRITVGTHKVVGEACTIMTIVGEGHALAVRLADGRGGGVVHLAGGASLELQRDPDHARQLTRRLQRFFAQLAQRGVLLHARCALVGGAELRGALPGRTATQISCARVAWIEGMVQRRGAQLQTVVVGGAEAREIAFDTATGALDIRPVRPRRRGTSTAAVPDCPQETATALRPGRSRVDMGCLAVARAPNELEALLGSCVGLAILDPEAELGGLVHIVLPESRGGDGDEPKYADTAVPALIDAVVDAGGCRSRLRASMAGGGNTLYAASGGGIWGIPAANVEATKAALGRAGVPLVGAEVGGRVARKMRVSLRPAGMRVTIVGDGREGSR